MHAPIILYQHFLLPILIQILLLILMLLLILILVLSNISVSSLFIGTPVGERAKSVLVH